MGLLDYTLAPPNTGYSGMQMPVNLAGLLNYGAPAEDPVAAAVPFSGQGMTIPASAQAWGNGMVLNNVVGGSPVVEPNAWMPDWLKGAIGTKEAPGWGGLAVGGASSIMNGILGMKQYGLAKEALAENKKQFQMNWDAQKTTTNTALEDRQRARVASNPGAYQSVGEYMQQNGIK